MNEKHFLRIVLIVSVLGIISLFIIAKNIQINDTTIQKINNEEIKGSIIVGGVVKEVQSSNKFTKLTIFNENEIDAVAYSYINISKGDNVKIIGKYENHLLIIDELTLI
ncbi:hypothetical protein HN789_02755 [archaeon]|jgi:alpha-N-acetylglucosamine transferase|nr:hypothetical protein [archaeon]MBT4021978.1 hypothetical protein [archaeon]MBT4272294.1 hypothetical protein [archaeon]MBT4460830.1 hypothetical protein [archaeon]MBT4858397.1 hypothetical protein [archaeon]